MDEISVKEKLLKSACDEFIKFGFKKASIRNIASGAGVTIGALYYFYDSKEELFLELYAVKQSSSRSFSKNGSKRS